MGLFGVPEFSLSRLKDAVMEGGAEAAMIGTFWPEFWIYGAAHTLLLRRRSSMARSATFGGVDRIS